MCRLPGEGAANAGSSTAMLRFADATGLPESIGFSVNYLLTEMGSVRMLRQLRGRR